MDIRGKKDGGSIIKVIYFIIGIQLLFSGLPGDVYAGLCAQSALRTRAAFDGGNIVDELRKTDGGGFSEGNVLAAPLSLSADGSLPAIERIGQGAGSLVVNSDLQARARLEQALRREIGEYLNRRNWHTGIIEEEDRVFADSLVRGNLNLAPGQIDVFTEEELIPVLEELLMGPHVPEYRVQEKAVGSAVRALVNRLINFQLRGLPGRGIRHTVLCLQYVKGEEEILEQDLSEILEGLSFSDMETIGLRIACEFPRTEQRNKTVADMQRGLSEVREDVAQASFLIKNTVARLTGTNKEIPFDYKTFPGEDRGYLFLMTSPSASEYIDGVYAGSDRAPFISGFLRSANEEALAGGRRFTITAELDPESDAFLSCVDLLSELRAIDVVISTAQTEEALQVMAENRDGGSKKNKALGMEASDKGSPWKQKKASLGELVRRAKNGDRTAQAELKKLGSDPTLNREIKRLQTKGRDGGTEDMNQFIDTLTFAVKSREFLKEQRETDSVVREINFYERLLQDIAAALAVTESFWDAGIAGWEDRNDSDIYISELVGDRYLVVQGSEFGAPGAGWTEDEFARYNFRSLAALKQSAEKKSYDGGYSGKVAILGGTGNIGQGFTARMADALIKVAVGSRKKPDALATASLWNHALSTDVVSGDTNNEVVKDADISVLAVNWRVVTDKMISDEAEKRGRELTPEQKTRLNFAVDTIYSVAKDLKKDSILLCPAVPMVFGKGGPSLSLPRTWEDDGRIVEHNSAAEQIAYILKKMGRDDIKVVSALHNIEFAILQDTPCPLKTKIVMTGDDAAAKKEVATLIGSLSDLEAVDSGPLANSYYVETLTPIDIKLRQLTVSSHYFDLPSIVEFLISREGTATHENVRQFLIETVDPVLLLADAEEMAGKDEISRSEKRFIKNICDFLGKNHQLEDEDLALLGELNSQVEEWKHEEELLKSLISAEAGREDLNDDMFRDYDYRSTGVEITPAVAFRLGLVWADMALIKARDSGIIGNRRVLISRDARKIDPQIVEALIAGIRYAGLDVIYTAEQEPNAVTSYSWAVQQYKPLMSIFNTASHVSRPKSEPVRGFKVAIMDTPGAAVQSLTTREIKVDSRENIISLIENPEKIAELKGYREGSYTAADINENCIRFNTLVARVAASGGSIYELARAIETADDPVEVLSEWEQRAGDVRPFEGVKLVIDGAHTPSGKLAAEPYKRLGAQVILINGDVREIEGEHKADPSKAVNLVELKNTIKEEKADFGMSFDLDGDRGAIVVPYLTGGKIDFDTLAPDNLMSVLLDNFVGEWGYREDTTGKKLAVIRDVLGTAGINDVGKKMGIKISQTDAGYVFLKKEGRNLRSRDYVIPVYGEKSGHCWLDVSGEIENPLAVSLLYVTMVRNSIDYDNIRAQDENPFYRVYRNKVIPYAQSPRFQPYFAPEFLQELALQTSQSIGWNGQGTPPAVIIAAGKDRAITALSEEFYEGRVFENTPAGTLRVEEFNTYRDPVEEGGLYRFADMKFVLADGTFAGRFVFRASSNDPTFVCVYETPVLEGDTEDFVEKKLAAVSGLVLNWLEENNFALVTSESIEEKQKISSEEAEKKAADSNLIPVSAHLQVFRQATSSSYVSKADGGKSPDPFRAFDVELEAGRNVRVEGITGLMNAIVSADSVDAGVYAEVLSKTPEFRVLPRVSSADEVDERGIYVAEVFPVPWQRVYSGIDITGWGDVTKFGFRRIDLVDVGFLESHLKDIMENSRDPRRKEYTAPLQSAIAAFSPEAGDFRLWRPAAFDGGEENPAVDTAGYAGIPEAERAIDEAEKAFKKFEINGYDDFAGSLRLREDYADLPLISGGLVIQADVILENPGTLAALAKIRKNRVDLLVTVYADSQEKIDALRTLGVKETELVDSMGQKPLSGVLTKLTVWWKLPYNKISVITSGADLSPEVKRHMPGVEVIDASRPQEEGKVNSMQLLIARAMVHIYGDQKNVIEKFKVLTRSAEEAGYITRAEKDLLDSLGPLEESGVAGIKATADAVEAQKMYKKATDYIVSMI